MESIAPGVEKLLVGCLRKAPASEAPLLAWPVVCGSAVATRTRAMEFSRGVLRVEVPDAAWRAELQHLAHRYVAIANKYTAGVSRIEFVVRGKGSQSETAT
jgi:hypothetical protein